MYIILHRKKGPLANLILNFLSYVNVDSYFLLGLIFYNKLVQVYGLDKYLVSLA